MRTGVITLPRVSVLLVTALCAVAAACSKQGAEVPQASASATTQGVATTRQIMLTITAPSSDAIFQVGEPRPDDDAAWEKLEAHAAALAESAHLLLSGPRAVNQPEWRGFCEELFRTAGIAAQAARRRSAADVLEAGNKIYETCDGCHQKYLTAQSRQ